MRTISHSVLVTAAMAALPLVSHATVTLTVALDTSASTLKYGPINGTMTSLPQGTNSSVAGANGAYFNTITDTAFIPAGDGMIYGYDGSMTGQDSSGISAGISSFGFFANNSSPSVAVPYSTTTSGTTAATKGALVFNGANSYSYNPAFSPTNTGETIISTAPKASGAPAGSVGTLQIVGGYLGVTDTNAPQLPPTYTAVGGSSPVLLISDLEFDLLSTTPGASTTITLSSPTSRFGQLDYYLVGSPGNYLQTEFTEGADTISVSGAALTIAVVPEPATWSVLALGAIGLLGRRRRAAAL